MTKFTAWFSVRYCAPVNQSLMLMLVHDDAPPEAAAARELLREVRCRRPGEAPQEWPAAAPKP